MRVKVEGVITSIEQKTKGDKKFTELLLAQQGQKEQVQVRLPGHVEKHFSLYEVLEVAGRLMIWTLREGTGNMVMADESDLEALLGVAS